MAELPKDFLYELLPAFYRAHDRQVGQPLRALVETLELECREIHRNIDFLYEGWFIETCVPWLVPYVGELLGIEVPTAAEAGSQGFRLRVANALAMRRRKGTRIGVEMAVHAYSGWPAQVSAKSSSDRGSDPDIKVKLWRLRSFPVEVGQARRLPDGVFTFHPLGFDSTLFHVPTPRLTLDQPVTDDHLPVPLSRRVLRAEIEALRQGTEPPTHFFEGPSAPRIWDPESGLAFRPEDFEIVSLAAGPPSADQISADPDRLFLDPRLGRFYLPNHRTDTPVRVSYAYGLSDDLGGGAYFSPSSSSSLSPSDEDPDLWQALIGRQDGKAPDGIPVFKQPLDALRQWVSSGRSRAILRFAGDDTWHLPSGGIRLTLPAGHSLVLTAETGCRPVLIGNLELISKGGPATASVEGLWLGGGLKVQGDCQLTLSDMTLQPGIGSEGSLVVGQDASAAGQDPEEIEISVKNSILGAIHHQGGSCELHVEDSILDGVADAAVVTRGAELNARLARVTVFGPSHFTAVEDGVDVLFAEPVTVDRRETGRLRFCWVPKGSTPPTCESCLPDDMAQKSKDLILKFRSRRYGAAAYGQLGHETSLEVRTGSYRGSEIGVFERLRNAERQDAVARVLKEQLPIGVTTQGRFMT